MGQLKRRIDKAAEPVRPPQIKPTTYEDTGEVVVNPEMVTRKAQEYVTFEVTSSKGKKYRVTTPSSYHAAVPKLWEWDERKLLLAEQIALGIPISEIVLDPAIGVKSRHTVYAWLEHPEFKEHVDALVLETGFANQRERIAGLSRMTQKLFGKIMREIEGLKLTDKSVGALISGIHAGMKHLATEKGEFVEHQNVQQQTNLTGTLATAQVNINEVIASKSEEERAALQKEFDSMGDDIIRSLTGAK